MYHNNIKFDRGLRLQIPKFIRNTEVNIVRYYPLSNIFFQFLRFHYKICSYNEFLKIIKIDRPDVDKTIAGVCTKPKIDSPKVRVEYSLFYKKITSHSGVITRRDWDIYFNEVLHIEKSKNYGKKVLEAKIVLSIFHELFETILMQLPLSYYTNQLEIEFFADTHSILVLESSTLFPKQIINKLLEIELLDQRLEKLKKMDWILKT